MGESIPIDDIEDKIAMIINKTKELYNFTTAVFNVIDTEKLDYNYKDPVTDIPFKQSYMILRLNDEMSAMALFDLYKNQVKGLALIDIWEKYNNIIKNNPVRELFTGNIKKLEATIINYAIK